MPAKGSYSAKGRFGYDGAEGLEIESSDSEIDEREVLTMWSLIKAVPLWWKMAGTALLAIAIVAGFRACATAGRPKTASDSFCVLYEPVAYALLKRSEIEAAAREGRAVRDDGNEADSAPTVATADRNNARYDAICGDPLAPRG